MDEAWTEVPFEEVIDFQEGPGIMARDFRHAGIPLVRLAGLERGAGSVLDGCNYLDPTAVEKRWSHFALQPGDVLLSTSASLGRIAVVGDDAAGAIAYTGIIRMRPRDGRLFAPFIRYHLEGPEFQRQAEMVGVGSVIRHFGPMHLRQMTVAIPPIDQQRAIAAILGALDDTIDLNRRMSETLEAMARALFKSWFVDFDPVRAKAEGRDPGLPQAIAGLFPGSFEDSALGEIPAGWSVDSVYAIGGVVYGAPFKSEYFNGNREGRPLIRIRDLATHDPEVFTTEVHPRGHIVRAGDLVVGMDGEFRAHLWRGPEAWLNQRVCSFVPGPRVPRAYVHYSVEDLLAFFERSKSGTTVIHLGKADIDTFRVLVPPSSILAAFGRAADAIDGRILASAQESRTLAELRDTLLPKLISGELPVTGMTDSSLELANALPGSHRDQPSRPVTAQ